MTRYAVEKLGKKRIAIAYQNDDYGKHGVKGAAEQLKKKGMKLVAEIPVDISDTDMRPHIMQLKKADADMVLLVGDSWSCRPARGNRQGHEV